MTGQVWAYARVSTRDQNPQLQLDALEASGYDTLVHEKESAKRGVLRPAWQELLSLPQPGDTLKFWKSDRWGRSAADVLATVTELRERGVKVVSLTENFDLGTKEGRLMFGVLARHRGRPHPEDRTLYRLRRPRRHLTVQERGRERPCQRSPGPGGRYSPGGRPVSSPASSMNRMNGERRSLPWELVSPGRRSVEPRQRLLCRAALCLAPGDFARRYPGLTGSAQRMDVAA